MPQQLHIQGHKIPSDQALPGLDNARIAVEAPGSRRNAKMDISVEKLGRDEKMCLDLLYIGDLASSVARDPGNIGATGPYTTIIGIRLQ